MAKVRSDLREEARDEILHAAVNAALATEESGNACLAAAIRTEATALCKKWGRTHWHGLPDTFPKDVKAPKHEPMF